MQFPLNLHLFGTEISTHLVTEIAAFFIGYRYYSFLKKRNPDNLPTETRLIILIAAAFGALLFSRLIAALENVNEWAESDNFWIYLYSSKTVVGGFLGGWLFVELAKKLLKLEKSTGDLMAFPIILALIIGRIGCFSQGVFEQTYGFPTTWFTGMNLGDGIQRHPLALYEICYLIGLWILLKFLQRNQNFKNGFQFKVLMFSYFFYRFFIEWAKPRHSLFLGLTSIQIGIILCYMCYFRTLIHLFSHPKQTLYGQRA